MYAYLEARKSTTSTALGEVRGVENYALKNTGVVGATVGLSSLGGVLFTVKGVEEEASVYGKGLKKYRLKGSWESPESETEEVLFCYEKVDLREDYLESAEEYNLFLGGESAAIGVGTKVKKGLDERDVSEGWFRLEGLAPIVYLSASEDTAYDEGLIGYASGKVYIKSSGEEMRQKGLTEPVGGWKVLSLGASQESLRKANRQTGRVKLTGGVWEGYLSHVCRDRAEYLTVVLEDEKRVGLSVEGEPAKQERVQVYSTDAELDAWDGLNVEGVGLSLESGRIVVRFSSMTGWVRFGGSKRWKGYGELNYVTGWVDYAEYISDRERWFREYEIRRRGHTIDYRRKSNGTGYGWSTTRRKNWDAFLYRELPLTVEVVLESELVRSESLTRFTAIGVEGREPTEAEVLLYDIELSADGLRWEASNVNLGVFKFSYGGLDGGVNSVGRKRLKKESNRVLGEGLTGKKSVVEEIAGFSSSSPYVFNIVDSKNVRDESNESVGYYIGSSKMQYGVNYIIEEGSEIRGIASGEVESSGDRGVNRLVFLKNKYNYSGRVKSLVGSDGENLVIGGGTVVRSIGTFKIDGVEKVEGVDWELVEEGGSIVKLKEQRGTGVSSEYTSISAGIVTYANEIVLSREGKSAWVGTGSVTIPAGSVLGYEKRGLSYSGSNAEVSYKNIVVGEVWQDLLKKVMQDNVLECRVFRQEELSVLNPLSGLGIEGGSFWYKGVAPAPAEQWLQIAVKEEDQIVEYFGEGELKGRKVWLFNESAPTDWKWRVEGESVWEEWDGGWLETGVALYRVKKPLVGEYNTVLLDLNLGAMGGIVNNVTEGLVRIEKRIASYEGISGAIALSSGEELEEGEELYVIYNLSEIVVASNGLNEEQVTEGVEEKVSFVNTEDVTCSVLGEVEMSKAVSSGVVSIVNLGDGTTDTGVYGVVGSNVIRSSFFVEGGEYRVTAVVGSSPRGGELLVKVTGSINEVYVEIKAGTKDFVVGGYGSNVERGEEIALLMREALVELGVMEGEVIEFGTHLFTIDTVNLGMNLVLSVNEEARYDVRVYVSGLDKGSSPNVFRVRKVSEGLTSDLSWKTAGWEVLGYNIEGSEIEISKGLESNGIEEGSLISLGDLELYRVKGEPREGLTSYVIAIEGKLGRVSRVGEVVKASVRWGLGPVEGGDTFKGKAVYTSDGYDLLYRRVGWEENRYDVLVLNEDYLLDTTTGAIRLLNRPGGVKVNDIYFLVYSMPLILKATVTEDGSRHYPKYEAIDIVAERVPTAKEVTRGLFYRGSKKIEYTYYIGVVSEEDVVSRIESGKSLEVYPSVAGLQWSQAGEGFGDYLLKDHVARNSLFKYQELLLNLESQLGCFKGDGSIIKEMVYWVEDGFYWGGWDNTVGCYNEEYFWGVQAGLATNQIDDKVREGYRWSPLFESRNSRFYPNRMEYVVKLETVEEFENGKSKKKKNQGAIQNLGFGEINLVTDIELQKRYSRFKVAGLTEVGQNVLYLSAVSLDLFPTAEIEESVFLPEEYFVSQAVDAEELPLYQNTGEMKVASRLPDVVSGRYDYFYKGLNVGSSIAVVKNKRGAGTAVLVYNYLYPIVVGPSYNASTGLTETKLGYARSVVESITDGYKVTISGDPIVLVGGTTVRLVDYLEVGDTIVEVAGGAFSDLSGEYNNIDPAELLSSGDSYIIGRDINFSRKAGEYYEKKLSSFWDPGFPWLELLGQNKPSDGMFYGGMVEFNNRDKEPYLTPGLDGEYQTNDNGDEGVPLLYRTGETKVLSESAGQISRLLRQEVTLGLDTYRVYPDEVRGDGGVTASTGVTKPFELLYNTSSNVPYYLGYIDALNAGYYTVFECASEQVAFRIDSVQYMPVNTLTTRLYRPFIGFNQTYSFYSLTNFIGLDDNFLDNEGLILTLQDEATSTKRVILYCGAVKSVQGSEGGPSIAVVSAEYVQAEGRLSITTAVADGDWFDMTDFNPSITPDPFAFIQVGSNLNWACSVDFLSKLGEIESNLKVFKCDSLLNSTLLGGLYSGAKLVIGADEVYGNQGTKIEVTDGVELFTNSSAGEYPVTDILAGGVVLIDVETPVLGEAPNWSILVGSEVDSQGFIFKETDPNKCAYIREYHLLTDGDALSPNDYSKVRAGDILVMYEGYEAGAHRIKSVQNTEYLGRKVLPIKYPRVETASQVLITVSGVTASELADMYPLGEGTVYFSLNASAQYKASWSERVDTSFTLAISGITDLAGNPITDLAPLVGSYLSGMTTLPVLEPLLDIPFEDIDGKLYQGEDEYLVTKVGDTYVSTGDVPLQLNIFIGVVEAQVKIRRGLYLDKDFNVRNKYTGASGGSLMDNITVYGVGSFNNTDPLTLTNVEVRRLRRFSDLYSRLSQNLKELYTFYAKHSGVTAGGVTFLANYYLLKTQVSLSETEAEYLGYMTESSPNLFSVELDKDRPKLKVGDELTLLTLKCKVVRVLEEAIPEVWFIIKDKNGMPSFSETLPNTLITNAQRGFYLPVDAIPAPYNAVMTYEIQYRNDIGEYPLEQTFESLIRNAFTEVYTDDNGNGVLDVDDVKHTGVTIEDLLLTYKLLVDGVPAVTETQGLADLVENCYLVIDAKGLLATGERSLPPEGDFWDGGASILNFPTALDDNRGVYRILGLTDGKMSVEPIIAIDGFLPTVNGVEGIDAHKLLVSLPPDEVTGFYGDNPDNHSIDNYSYKILRRKGHISQSLADLILFMRERTYSWMDKLVALEQIGGSTWDYFESEGYMDVGLEDAGSLPDVRLLGYEGNVEAVPDDKSTIDRLSILERRYWIEDSRIDVEGYEGYPSPGAFTSIEEAIKNEGLRDLRNDWIEKRIDLTDGTLVKVRRYNW